MARTGQRKGQGFKDFFDDWWFKGRAYKKGQPFATFSRQALMHENWSRDLRASILTCLPDPHHPEKSVGLEIGPGISPLLMLVPELKRTFFLEQSHELSKNLGEIQITLPQNTPNGTVFTETTLAQWLGNKMMRITGDIRHLPITPNAKFDIITFAEVLTHLKPQDQQTALKQLAKRTNALLIIDRQKTTLKDYAQRHPELTPETLKNMHKTNVNPNPIIKFLQQNGFTVIYQQMQAGRDKYFMILAKK